MIPKHIKCEIKEVKVDSNGRYVLVKGVFNNNALTLLNIYAPTQDKQQQQINLLDELTELINETADNLIWGGDFNLHLEPTKDKFQCTQTNCTQAVNYMKELMDNLNICDVWRIMNPNAQRYTWRTSSVGGIKQSRLDYWLIPTGFVYKTKKCEINVAVHTDHSIISLYLQENGDNTRGRGLWKFNSSLLTDREYVDNVNNLLLTCADKYKNLQDHGLKWDVIKTELRGYTISYASHKWKERHKFEKNL